MNHLVDFSPCAAHRFVRARCNARTAASFSASGERGWNRRNALPMDTRITSWQILHMRTTITIAEELLKEAQELSGKTGYSEAIVSSLQDYVELRKRLRLLEDLFEHKTPHSYSRIKSMRRTGRWSS
jgi:Arc/MetJ family transcription regulator